MFKALCVLFFVIFCAAQAQDERVISKVDSEASEQEIANALVTLFAAAIKSDEEAEKVANSTREFNARPATKTYNPDGSITMVSNMMNSVN